jgi:DNA-binding MarR family transcriptional regulator
MSGTERARRAARIVASIFEAAGRLRRAGEGVAAEQGQTQARWQVMSVISEGSWTVPRIAGRLGITRQSVQRVADELVRDGLARYAENPSHARSPFVQITAPGTRTLAAITAGARGLDGRIATAIGERHLDAVHAALERLLGDLRALDSSS